MNHDSCVCGGLGVGPDDDRRDARSIPRATPRRVRVARDRDGDDDGDDVGRLALSRVFDREEEAEDWEARDDDDDRDGVRTRASDDDVVEGEGEDRGARGRGAGERGGRGGR